VFPRLPEARPSGGGSVHWRCPFCDKLITRRGNGPRARHLGQVHAARVSATVQAAFEEAGLLSSYEEYASGDKADSGAGRPAAETVRTRLGYNLLSLYEDAVMLSLRDPTCSDAVELL